MTYKVKLAKAVYQDIRFLDKKTISIIKSFHKDPKAGREDPPQGPPKDTDDG